MFDGSYDSSWRLNQNRLHSADVQQCTSTFLPLTNVCILRDCSISSGSVGGNGLGLAVYPASKRVNEGSRRMQDSRASVMLPVVVLLGRLPNSTSVSECSGSRLVVMRKVSKRGIVGV